MSRFTFLLGFALAVALVPTAHAHAFGDLTERCEQVQDREIATTTAVCFMHGCVSLAEACADECGDTLDNAIPRP